MGRSRGPDGSRFVPVVDHLSLLRPSAWGMFAGGMFGFALAVLLEAKTADHLTVTRTTMYWLSIGTAFGAAFAAGHVGIRREESIEVAQAAPHLRDLNRHRTSVIAFVALTTVSVLLIAVLPGQSSDVAPPPAPVPAPTPSTAPPPTPTTTPTAPPARPSTAASASTEG